MRLIKEAKCNTQGGSLVLRLTRDERGYRISQTFNKAERVCLSVISLRNVSPKRALKVFQCELEKAGGSYV